MRNSLISNGVNTLTLISPISIRAHKVCAPMTLNLKLFWVLILFSILSLLIIYIFQINSLASQNYHIQNYEKKLVQISQENKVLEINFSKANSLNNIGNYLQNENFEKVTQVKYIQILETEIAKGK